jgi:serine/threonine-protein kinase RsbW
MATLKIDTLHIESRTERLIAVRDFVSAAAREFGFADEEISKIALAVDEACTNVIKHAYEFDSGKQITVTVKRGDDAFEVTIRDTGKQFDATNLQPPDMKEYLSHFRRGGLGVYLMKTLMDKIEYKFEPGQPNEVCLTKYLSR